MLHTPNRPARQNQAAQHDEGGAPQARPSASRYEVLIARNGTTTLNGERLPAAEGQEVHVAVLDALHQAAHDRLASIDATILDLRENGYATHIRVAPDGSSQLLVDGGGADGRADAGRTAPVDAAQAAPDGAADPAPEVQAAPAGAVPAAHPDPPTVVQQPVIPGQRSPHPAPPESREPAPQPPAPAPEPAPAPAPEAHPHPAHPEPAAPARAAAAAPPPAAAAAPAPTAEPAPAAAPPASKPTVPAEMEEAVGQINRAAAEGETQRAMVLAYRLRDHAVRTYGQEHPYTLETRDLEAYVARLGGNYASSTRIYLELAQICQQQGNPRAYGYLKRASGNWQMLKDPQQLLTLGRAMLHTWSALASEGGPAAADTTLPSRVQQCLEALSNSG